MSQETQRSLELILDTLEWRAARPKSRKPHTVGPGTEVSWSSACYGELQWPDLKWNKNDATTIIGARCASETPPAWTCSVFLRNLSSGSDYP